MAKYVYPAIFAQEDNVYTVRFPDIEGCYTHGETLSEAMDMAKDALNLMLYGYEVDGVKFNPPSDIRKIELEENEFTSLISCDTIEYRRYFDNKAVKKTLTIPNWLNVMSEKAHVNFSAVLQEALMEKLGIEH
jgi:predicted RNase H-like HicB family nuclease